MKTGKRPKFKIKGNVREILAYLRKNKFNSENTPAEREVRLYLSDLISLRRRLITNDERVEDTAIFLAQYLFPGIGMDQGIERYLQMFSDLKDLNGAEQYGKQISKFIKWLKYIKERDVLLETHIDDNLVEGVEKNPKILKYLLDKYETLNTETDWR